MTDILTAAQEYTERGMIVHPLSNPSTKEESAGKRPLLKDWGKRTQPAKEDELKGWFDGTGKNIGLVCGKASNHMVLDFDHKLFYNWIFGEGGATTLRSQRTEGREHVHYSHNRNIPSQKHHDLGIEILSDGSNAVLPPSVHQSGDVYRWLNPDIPITAMPNEVEKNLIKLFQTEAELKRILSKGRHCFRTVIKNRKEIDWHGAEGREYMLAVCTDLKANGASEEHVRMFATMVYGEKYDEVKTSREWANIDPTKTWTCDKLREKLPAFVVSDECEKCETRRQNYKNEQTPQPQKKDDEENGVPPHIREKAEEIMKNGDVVQYIIDEHQKHHVGDVDIAKALLVSIGIQSVLNSDGIHPKVSGESGKGKTHCCKAMGHMIPKEYFIKTGLSDKAIYYMKLRAGCVVFSDDANLSESMDGIIKRATTNFQEGDSYTTVDITRNLKELYIPPRVSWWLTSVDDDQSLQLLNRTFGGGVDETSPQDDNVFQYQVKQATEGEVSFPETDDVEVCREIIRNVKKQLFRVKIPFANGIIWKDKGNRRNFPIFLDIVKAFAVI